MNIGSKSFWIGLAMVVAIASGCGKGRGGAPDALAAYQGIWLGESCIVDTTVGGTYRYAYRVTDNKLEEIKASYSDASCAVATTQGTIADYKLTVAASAVLYVDDGETSRNVSVSGDFLTISGYSGKYRKSAKF